ncbi:hypothetical protein [Dyadobacter sp. LHD-138]|uniref:hypothetical protein n=1 Tax=Dyadobacter sp. LHD-138 TaxID=3071413 RepID=UPI0027E17F2C|nr:hypothetical protein [Dyadobacter sp. LHD-138]MDQ6480289.1 hypothetical protein [Dyadobacter sp. LHD-138]
MSKKNLHIKKYLNGKLSEPEVQADDAWAQMNDMLDNDSQTPVPSVPGTHKSNAVLKGGLAVIAALGIAALIWLFLPGNPQKNKAGITLEKLSQDKNTAIIPAHKEDNKNTLTNQGTAKDSTDLSLSPAENKIETDSTVSIGKQQDKLSSDKNLAITTHPSTDSKTGKKNIKNRTDQAGRFEPKTNKPSAVKFKTLLKNEAGIAGNSTAKNTRSENLYPKSNVGTDLYDKNQNRSKKEKATGDNSDYAVSPENSQTYNLSRQTISKISNNPDMAIKRIAFSVQNLTPKSTQFNNLSKNLAKTVKYNAILPQQKASPSKEKKALFKTLHAGLEWNVTAALNNTQYIFTATDSTNKPYMLLIPGIWLSKDLTENQSLTLSFYANQAYFGGLKRIRRIDADSVFHNNINLIKATGINLSLQYNYRFISKLGISAGISYSPLRSALAQNEEENYQGKIISGSKLVLKKDNMDQYMKTNLFVVKTGLTFTPGRYQFGINLLIPLSNLSITPTSSLKTMNGQLFFRFRIK